MTDARHAREGFALDMGGEVLSVPQLARRSGIGVRRLRRLVASGEIPAYGGGGHRLRVLWSDFLTWLKTTRVRPPSRAAEAHVERRVAEILAREHPAGKQ